MNGKSIRVCHESEWLQCSLWYVFNNEHPDLKLTIKYESADRSPFLDLLLTRKHDGSLSRTVYRKASWIGLYTNFNSYTFVRHKRALVQTLLDRARQSCAPDRVAPEPNGCPESSCTKDWANDWSSKEISLFSNFSQRWWSLVVDYETVESSYPTHV